MGPDATYFRIQESMSNVNHKATVSDLIDQNSRQWKIQMVEEFFSKEEAELIKWIPISYSNCEDKLIWTGTSQDTFLVKSAYHIHKELKEMEKGHRSSSYLMEKFGSRLWKSKVHPIDKIFLWRACYEALPTNLNLFKKKILEKPFCPICLQDEETVIHALWSCPAAQDVWYQRPRQFQKSRTFVHSIYNLIVTLVSSGKKELVEELAVDSMNLQLQKIAEYTGPPQLNSNWSPPLPHAYKINWDAAIDKMHCKVGIRIILGLTKIIIEGDSLQLIQAINGKGENWFAAGMMIDDVNGHLSYFESWLAIHIRREGNKAAHVLAKNALLTSTSSVVV
ncbi:uncharacterized protein LOC121267283 [Juglans microcarpa x Juglans regia]|uniref:uncharacterized protein LOC121267283 n=1 Tax=Juglans microcarpa x Juglans regia TaxID=2249226 RepID=UPI001B7E8712|nr:uncharacterized protein LOC121267283 [Juglans microcarpa x Juglans regia]